MIPVLVALAVGAVAYAACSSSSSSSSSSSRKYVDDSAERAQKEKNRLQAKLDNLKLSLEDLDYQYSNKAQLAINDIKNSGLFSIQTGKLEFKNLYDVSDNFIGSLELDRAQNLLKNSGLHLFVTLVPNSQIKLNQSAQRLLSIRDECLNDLSKIKDDLNALKLI